MKPSVTAPALGASGANAPTQTPLSSLPAQAAPGTSSYSTKAAGSDLGTGAAADSETIGEAFTSLDAALRDGPVSLASSEGVPAATAATPGQPAESLSISTSGMSLAAVQPAAAQLSAAGGSATAAQLAGFWKFNEGSGLVALDSSGKGNNGSLQGAGWVPGMVGAGALDFNGSSLVSVPNSASLSEITNNFTIAFWAKPRSTHEIDPEATAGYGGTTGQRYAFGAPQGESAFGTADHAGVGVSVGTNGVSVYEHTSNYMPATLVYEAPVSGWTHIALVYENRQPKLYVNGALAKVGQLSPKSFVHAAPQNVGGYPYGYFDGQMDEVRVYKGVLSAEQVKAIATPPAKLVAQWKLDENNGTVARDATGGGNDGTLQQGAAWSNGKVGAGALSFNGAGGYMSVPNNPNLANITNNFTVTFWAKPRSAHEIDPESATGIYGTTGQKFAFGAPQGEGAFGTADHAGIGLSVGTNGVSVYEHTSNHMPATLVYQSTLSDWTHVALVYENKQPKLYVNGVFVKAGVGSLRSFVHAAPQNVGGYMYGYFDGQMDDVRIYDGVAS
ncbi:MAG TPA: LamG domain-containing protein, partial [Pyrinomonadaceae bacterium]